MEQKNGLEDYYSIKNNRKMRFGYTTGSCAAGAAKAAVSMLLKGGTVKTVELMTPKGILLNLEILHIEKGIGQVSCAVKKFAGDDPDVTDGIEVFVKAEKTNFSGIRIEGGKGVGRVTKRGLEQPVGSPAINQVPRSMILREAEEICSETDYEGGLLLTVSIPQGEEIAGRTFNPRLGIEGGISVLGTSGIVEPMSEAALIKSIEVEMRQKVENGAAYLLVTPGNYGASFLREHMDLPSGEHEVQQLRGRNLRYGCGYGGEGHLIHLPYRQVREGGSRDYEYPFQVCGRQGGSPCSQCPARRDFPGRRKRDPGYHHHGRSACRDPKRRAAGAGYEGDHRPGGVLSESQSL